MKPSRRSRAIGHKEVCAYGFLFCSLDRNRKVSPKGSPEVAVALNACAQSDREKSRTNARAVLTRFWAGSGSGLPDAVIIPCNVVFILVKFEFVEISCGILNVQYHDVVGIFIIRVKYAKVFNNLFSDT